MVKVALELGQWWCPPLIKSTVLNPRECLKSSPKQLYTVTLIGDLIAKRSIRSYLLWVHQGLINGKGGMHCMYIAKFSNKTNGSSIILLLASVRPVYNACTATLFLLLLILLGTRNVYPASWFEFAMSYIILCMRWWAILSLEISNEALIQEQKYR